MKVVLAAPNFHQPRGNTVTVRRISEGLENLGVETKIISITEDTPSPSLPSADVVHGFHAYRFYQFMQTLNKPLKPYIVTLTGTDLNHDLFDQNRREDVLRCLTGAKAIHVFDDEARHVLLKEVPNIDHKTFTIHQGTRDFPDTNLNIKKEPNTFLFVLPAGIRKVKNIPFAIQMLSTLHEKRPNIRLWLVGPIIEDEEGNMVKILAEQNSDWVQYIGQVPHNKMGGMYQQADVILNTSHSEGQPSSILEAMSYGLPVIASNNLGNRNIISHQETGLLYDESSEFLDHAEELINNNELRQTIGQSAQQYITGHHSSRYEAESLLNIYHSLIIS
ncbi:glycosyltransferase [Tuberibacillus sp. Marseille-P3662]|uniref:glycosyltransferase n=1 Tax=Tuberibacillus sp. Marseille-P3662 TaxID=1965358 RepID=UPI0015935C26|nr:glycosyltransferase [Tuberibacillus sp. Marseille-P3662]